MKNQTTPAQAQTSVCHLKKPSTNSVGNWTPGEDEQILKYVYQKDRNKDSMMWGNLQQNLNGRSGKSCRERWFNHLDPKIKRSEWSVEEQWVLFILRNQQEEKWSLISKTLMGRTDNAVKNYWNSRLRKRIENMQKAYELHFERKKKQKLFQLLDKQEELQKLPVDQLESKLGPQQQKDLQNYMERLKSDYLNKIIEQIDKQNMDYYSELASEYELQKQQMENNMTPTPIIQDNSSPHILNMMDQDTPLTFLKEDEGMAVTDPQQYLITDTNKDLEEKPPADQNLIAQKAETVETTQTESKQSNVDMESIQKEQIDAQKEQEKSQVDESKIPTGNMNDAKDPQTIDMDQDQGESQTTDVSYVFRSLETLQMHIDILYKSVPFLDRNKIQKNLLKFKKQKQQLLEEKIRRDEELQRSGKKKKVKREEEVSQNKFATAKNNGVSFTSSLQKKDSRVRSTEDRSQYLTNYTTSAENGQNGVSIQGNICNGNQRNELAMNQSSRKGLSAHRNDGNLQNCQPRGNLVSSSQALRNHNSAGKKQLGLSTQKKNMPYIKSESNLMRNQNHSASRRNKGEFGTPEHGGRLREYEEEDIVMSDDDKSDASSSSSDAESVHSRYSKGSRGSRASKKSNASRASLSHRVIKKIKKQKKKSKLIEKIFLCEKQERELTKPGSTQNPDPYALKPIQETGMSGVSDIYLQNERIQQPAAAMTLNKQNDSNNLAFMMSPTLTNKMNQLNICSPQIKITAFPNSNYNQQIGQTNDIINNILADKDLQNGINPVSNSHLMIENPDGSLNYHQQQDNTYTQGYGPMDQNKNVNGMQPITEQQQTQLFGDGTQNDNQQVTGSAKKSLKQVRFRKLKTRKKADEIATLRREEQRLDQRGILKRSHSVSFMENQGTPHHYWESDNRLDQYKSSHYPIYDENSNNINIKPFQYSENMQTQKFDEPSGMQPLDQMFNFNRQMSHNNEFIPTRQVPLFGNLPENCPEETGQEQIKESETMTPGLTHQSKELPHDMRGYGLFRMQSLSQPIIDPLTQSPALPSDVYNQSDLFPQTSQNVEEDEHLIVPRSEHLPFDQDQDDDHLIDPTVDNGFDIPSSSYTNQQQNRKRNGSLKAHKSTMKKRMMLQTRNFMNMTMAQMVSDPHHYQGTKNIKYRQGGAMTPQRIEKGPNCRLENQSSSGAKSGHQFHGNLVTNKVSSFTDQKQLPFHE